MISLLIKNIKCYTIHDNNRKQKLILIIGLIAGICIIKSNEDTDYEFKEHKSSDISNMKSFYFTYTNGYAMNSYTRYEIKKEDDKYVASIKQDGKSEEETVKVNLSESSLKELEDILNKYNVSDWDGFNKTDKDVLDGDSFSCSIGMENGKGISASGYMKWPKNYKEVVSELDTYFSKLISKE